MHNVVRLPGRNKRDAAQRERAGAWALQQALADDYKALRAIWHGVLPIVLVPIACGIAVTIALGPSYFTGLLTGALIIAGFGASGWLVQSVSGTAFRRAGGEAERWTDEQLRPLVHRGWHLVNHVRLGKVGDIDHVLVGPGGLYAVETKYSTKGWDPQAPSDHLRSAIEQARRNAHRLSVWSPDKAVVGPAQTILVLWGGRPRNRNLDGHRVIDDVIVMHGSSVSSWRSAVMEDRLDHETVRRVVEKLKWQMSVRDTTDPLVGRPYFSPLEAAEIAARTLFAGFLGIVTTLLAVPHVSWWLVLPVAAVAATPAQLFRRHRTYRWPALAWQTGAVTTGLLIEILGIASRLG